MSDCSSNKPCCKWAIQIVAILGTFLIVGWLVSTMVRHTTPAPLGQGRADERRKALIELRAAEIQALNNYAWQDQAKGIVRLPVARALELSAQQKDLAAARASLLSRLDKATAAPPKAPEKPSEFE